MPAPSLHPPADDETARLRRELQEALAALAAQESRARRQVADAVDRERRRFADSLHRTASQTLTAAYYQAIVLARRPPADPAHAADLAALPDLIHRVIGELRDITQEFREPGD